MIDVENEIITAVATALRGKYGANFFVTGEPIVDVPGSLPAVGIMEVNNTEPKATRDSSGTEKYADLLYQVSVYTNKQSGKKSQSKEILSVIDDVLRPMNFRRESNVPETPLNDGKIYWKTVRYVVRTNGTKLYGN